MRPPPFGWVELRRHAHANLACQREGLNKYQANAPDGPLRGPQVIGNTLYRMLTLDAINAMRYY